MPDDRLILEGVDKDTIDLIFKYAYYGEITVTIDELEMVLRLGQFYGISHMLIAATEFMKNHIDKINYVDFYLLSNQYGLDEMCDFCYQLILRDFADLSQTTDLRRMPIDHLERILSDDDLHAADEKIVARVVLDCLRGFNHEQNDMACRLLLTIRMLLLGEQVRCFIDAYIEKYFYALFFSDL